MTPVFKPNDKEAFNNFTTRHNFGEVILAVAYLLQKERQIPDGATPEDILKWAKALKEEELEAQKQRASLPCDTTPTQSHQGTEQRHCLGPLPGRNVTVVQDGEKTKFVHGIPEEPK